MNAPADLSDVDAMWPWSQLIINGSHSYPYQLGEEWDFASPLHRIPMEDPL